MKKVTNKGIGTFLILFLIFFLLVFFNAFTHLHSVLIDKMYGGDQPLDNIVIIKIDDESINKIGRWPWDRDVFSRILSNIENAKVIGMDLSFFEESEDDQALKSTLSSRENIILASEVNNNILYKPIFDNDIGYVNFKADNDGVIRKVDPTLTEDILPFSFEIYKKGWDQNFQADKKEYIINFPNNPNSFPSITAYEVFQEKQDFENKFVLIGATAPNLHDNYFVPTSNGIAMSGVEIHASILHNLILDNFLAEQGKLSILILVFIIGLIGLFILSKLKIYYSIPIVLVIIVIYSLIAILVFSKFDYIINLFFFPLSLLIFTGTGFGLNYMEQKKHSDFITNAFSKYISKDVIDQIMVDKEGLKLGGGKKTITIFFSDIRGFTTISEHLTPEQLVHLLNEYLTEMTQIILKNKGTVDKFIGDAIMAFWNAPLEQEDHAVLASKTAIEQIEVLKELRNKWKSEGLPEVKIGIGLHTGEAIIGNMGSEDRFDYTAMGDTINLGSRLEGLTKEYGVAILISEETYKGIKDELTCRKLDKVKVKGKNLPVTIYELCIEPNERFNKQYEKALELYLKADFKKAIKEFETAKKIKDHKSCDLFIERCKIYIKTPPSKDWDGAFVFKTK